MPPRHRGPEWADGEVNMAIPGISPLWIAAAPGRWPRLHRPAGCGGLVLSRRGRREMGDHTPEVIDVLAEPLVLAD
jgi:hypothetical protein